MKSTFIYLTGLCLFFCSGQAQRSLPHLNTFKETIDSCGINLRRPTPPLIGLSVAPTDNASSLSAYYFNAVVRAGGAPVLIPAITDVAALRHIVSNLDGLVLTGGKDVNPLWYQEQPHPQLGEVDPLRDAYELTLIKLASDRNIPILGICRGEQLINVAFGGTLYQDIPSQHTRDTGVKHVQKMPGQYVSHTVSVKPESQLSAIIGPGIQGVNTFHHQAVKEVAPGFRAVAYSTDSIVEAIEAWPERPILGVQWHPEALVDGGDTTMLKLFAFLTAKANTFRQAKEIHKRILSVDTHTDTPFWFGRPGFSLADRERNRVNLPKMEEGGLDAVFLAAFIGQGKRDNEALQTAVDRTTQLIESIHRQAEQNADLCGLAITPDDFARLKKTGKKTIFIGIENGYGIGKDLSNLSKFKQMGVTYMTLCHSYDNDICDSSTHTQNEWDGLSPFGKEVVGEMNRLGLMIDLSHASESTFRDVMEQSAFPVICSHSSARALCDHDRNLTDEQLRAIAQNGGVVQVCLLDSYIHSNRREASVVHAVDHIDHIVQVAGINHVGIGSDFDGGGGIIGCEAHNDLIQITVKLLEKGYTEEDLGKIWSGNFLRVMSAVQSVY
ncbi:MAG: gamma-glutamyl-gamma-aminobutyrate hydrolase family protein [Tannerellaceae bacterium]|jgi:microsomal dipeptidase-like Zn-dependent dipeptidase/gamma-glutamyl-gamma-aminobutyrate hydrolase PuuD|nr:gamma-glutamyl-gamma-aminobutyrate hydrolase family protein [Tannerellaceae bacterium]